MFGLESLDVVIGLFFVYLLLSLICVALNEVIAHFLHLRGKMLRDAIYQLLLTTATRPDRAEVAKSYGNELMNKKYTATGYELAAKLYAHPLVAGMKERFSLRIFNFFRRKGLPPSYIPSKTFVTALLDVVRRNGLEKDAALPPIAGLTMLGPKLEKDFGPVGQVLRLLAEQAEGNLERFEASLESWFNESMDRLGAAYKRRVQLVGMLVAVVVAVSVNANTLTIVRTLSTNSTLRAALVGLATQAAADSSNRGMPAVTPNRDSAFTRLTNLTRELDSLNVLGLPIGYPPLSARTDSLRAQSTMTFASAMFKERYPDVKKGWLGLLITSFAITLGAPFWFDLLNRAVSLRSSGAKPGEADEKKQK